jgi:hypothetical protein
MASRALKLDYKKSDTNQPSEYTERNISEAVSKDVVAVLAYQLWQERGCPVGSDQEDWFQAEQELRDRTETFPTAA